MTPEQILEMAIDTFGLEDLTDKRLRKHVEKVRLAGAGVRLQG